MYVLKQKDALQNTDAKLGKKLVSWYTLRLVTPTVLGVSIFGLVLYAQPRPTQIDSQNASVKKSQTHHVAAAVKVSQPATPAPKVSAPVPQIASTAPPVTVKIPPQSGTPKPEPVVTPSPSSNVSGLAPTTPAPSPASSPAPSSKIATGYTSTNWSGYLAAAGSFTGISGSWNATLATGNGSSTSADSTWIGIGGVTSGDLIQVGTQNIIAANGQVSSAAFYELLPSFSQPVPGITVLPGDNMSASVSEISSGQWAISITDKTDRESYSTTVTYASSLSSAEWIEEDPSYSFRRQIPFDNFHEAIFTNGSTVSNGNNLNIAASTAQPVTMVDSTGQNVVAQPSAIGSDGASFTVSP